MRYPEYEDLLSDTRPPIEQGDADAGYTAQLDADTDLQDFLTQSKHQEQDRIETQLEKVDQQLENRSAIHEQTTDSLQELLRHERNQLDQVSIGVAQRDQVLEQQRRIHDLEQQLQKSRRANWRDQKELKQERRRLRRELSELTDTDLSRLL